jgi:fructose-1,6-bisphosphatase/inositol monophosphatase family enzyme
MDAVGAVSREASTKRDGSFVTATDCAVEEYFTAELQAAWPDIPVLGEERVSQHDLSGEEPHRYYQKFMQSPFQIIIDPIDGTRNFIEGKREFCVAAALTHRVGEGIWPICSVVAVPVRGVMYFCDSRGVFSEEIRSGAVAPVTRSNAEPERFSVSSKDRAWLTDNNYSLIFPWVSSGSSVHDFLETALGSLRGSLVGKQRLWDLMAPLAIADRLGCVLCDLATGEQLTTITSADLSLELERRPWGVGRRMVLLPKGKRISEVLLAG